MKKIITSLICFLLPRKVIPAILCLLGHKIHKTAKIGFSLVLCPHITMEENTIIGNFNIIRVPKVSMKSFSYIGRFNNINGDIEIILCSESAIGNSNSISRSPSSVYYKSSVLELGCLSKLTHRHQIDCMKNIVIGNYTTIAGSGTQIWTHGYIHEKEGRGRIRIDGEVRIGNNVYVGSRCMINAGVYIADGITLGSNASVSKSLLKTGMYVSQPLRFIENDIASVRNKLSKVNGEHFGEEVYEKRIDEYND